MDSMEFSACAYINTFFLVNLLIGSRNITFMTVLLSAKNEGKRTIHTRFYKQQQNIDKKGVFIYDEARYVICVDWHVKQSKRHFTSYIYIYMFWLFSNQHVLLWKVWVFLVVFYSKVHWHCCEFVLNIFVEAAIQHDLNKKQKSRRNISMYTMMLHL